MATLLATRRAELGDLCRRFGVRRLELSDITGRYAWSLDFVIDFDYPDEPGLADRYHGLIAELEVLFGRRVGLTIAPGTAGHPLS